MNNTKHCYGCGPIARFFYRRMPSGVKRMVFVISVVKALTKDRFGRLDSIMIWQINKVLRLTQSNSSEALMLIDRITKLEWSIPGDTAEICTAFSGPDHEVALPKIADEVVNASPVWLRYADNETIKRDLVALFSNSDFLLHFYLRLATKTSQGELN